jgi:hypothetical protein
MARVLVLTGDAAEELDSMYPVFRLREGGHDAVVAARTARAVKLVVHDFEPDCDAYTEKPGHLLPVDVVFGDVNPEDYDALVIPHASARALREKVGAASPGPGSASMRVLAVRRPTSRRSLRSSALRASSSARGMVTISDASMLTCCSLRLSLCPAEV